MKIYKGGESWGIAGDDLGVFYKDLVNLGWVEIHSSKFLHIIFRRGVYVWLHFDLDNTRPMVRWDLYVEDEAWQYVSGLPLPELRSLNAMPLFKAIGAIFEDLPKVDFKQRIFHEGYLVLEVTNRLHLADFKTKERLAAIEKAKYKEPTSPRLED